MLPNRLAPAAGPSPTAHTARTAYFDCFSGAAGDMILAALIDAGCPLDALQAVLARLNLPGVSLHAEKVKKQGIAATQVTVALSAEAPRKHRHLSHILKLIDDAGLDAPVAENAARIFRRLAEAEAAVHATTVEKVHFHEVGADDAIVDIVCTCAALHELRLTRLLCSAIPTGSGTVRCQHGVMPVPAPATANLLRGVPLADCDEIGELTTPTGAVVLTTLCERFGPMPGLRIERIGYGAGTRDAATRPNVLRVIVGQTDEAREAGAGHAAGADAASTLAIGAEAEAAAVVAVLEANLDDATGQQLAHAAQMLHDAGALDVFFVPIMMKKGRPGQLISVLCRVADAAALEGVLLRETTTFGVRRHDCVRTTLEREHAAVETPFGAVRVKIGRRDGQVLQAWPEYDDCEAAARRGGVTLRQVQAAALEAWRQAADGKGE